MEKAVKYSNRKIYSKQRKKYITTEELPEMGRIIITDHRTGNDVTAKTYFEAAVAKLRRRNMELDAAIVLTSLLGDK